MKSIPALALLLVVLVYALGVRAESFYRPFWADEHAHALTVLNARDVLDLPRQWTLSLQPTLEYAIRKTVWIPLLGKSEKAQRLPSLFYSLITLAFVWYAVRSLLRKQGWDEAFALIGAMAVSLFVVFQPAEVYYATEVRHYALISLASIVWCLYTLFFFSPQGKRVTLFFLSLFFLNLHYFALVLFGVFYVWLAVEDSRAKRWAALRTTFLASLLIVAVSVLPNFENSSNSLAQAGMRQGGVQFVSLIYILRDLSRYFSLTFCFCLAALISLFALCEKERRGKAVLFLGFVAVIPVFLLLYTSKTAWPFAFRYAFPFSGVFVSLLVWACLSVSDWHRWATRGKLSLPSQKSLNRLALPLMVVIFAWLGTPDIDSLRKLWDGPANYSKASALFQRVLRDDAPVLFFNDDRNWAELQIDFHRARLKPGGPSKILMVDLTADSPLRCQALRQYANGDYQAVLLASYRGTEREHCHSKFIAGVKAGDLLEDCLLMVEQPTPLTDLLPLVERWGGSVRECDLPRHFSQLSVRSGE